MSGRSCSGSKPVENNYTTRLSPLLDKTNWLQTHTQSTYPRPFYLEQGSTITSIYLVWWDDGEQTDGHPPPPTCLVFVCVRVGVHICLGTQSAEGWSQADRCRVMPLSWIFYLFIINTQPGSQEQTLKDSSTLHQCSGIFMASFQSCSLKSLN